MSDIDLDNALSQFYEDESLTDALTDQPADILLKWGETQIQFLAQQARDEDEFDNHCTSLRKLIRNVSRYVAEHHHMEPEEQQESLNRISGFAQAIGLSIIKAIENIIEEQKTLSDTDSVTHFLAQIASPVGTSTASPESPRAPSQPTTTVSPVDDTTEILPRGPLMDLFQQIADAIVDATDELKQQASSDDKPVVPDDDIDL